jgi:alkylation response protein AidB-like acyl-CoA dehydrogenase
MENAAELQAPPAPALSVAERGLLARAEEVAETLLEPRAEAVDQSGRVPVENLEALAAAGLVAVTTPREWGGHGASGAFQREFTETLTAACGTTWFVLTQHLGACSQLAGSENPSLRERFLRDAAAGRHWIGVGFGHLRRPEPMLRARRVDGGYILDGVAPWVTGWPILAGVIYGAVLEDGERHVYLYAPAAENEHLRSSPPLPLCAMNASATTEVRLEGLFVPDDDFVRFSSRTEMARGDERNIAGATPPPLGCTRGSVRHLRRIAEKRAGLPAIADAADRLAAELDALRAESRRIADGPKDTRDYKPAALAARTGAIELAVRAAHAAVAASGGAANALTHPAQRRYREAMFYTLAAQTGDILAATVSRLAR